MVLKNLMEDMVKIVKLRILLKDFASKIETKKQVGLCFRANNLERVSYNRWHNTIQIGRIKSVKQTLEMGINMSTKLKEYFNKQPRLGSLSTSSKDGKVDAAIFGSTHMIDEKTVAMGTAKNRTLANLQENPHAVFMIMEPGNSVFEWKGVRVYLKVKDISTSGEMLDTIRDQVSKFVSESAAKMMHAAVTFEVEEIRPLIDFGQGWEKSI